MKWFKFDYQKSSKIKYNNKLFRIFIRDDKKLAFLRIIEFGKAEKYEMPSAQEFLHLSSCFTANRIKF